MREEESGKGGSTGGGGKGGGKGGERGGRGGEREGHVSLDANLKPDFFVHLN